MRGWRNGRRTSLRGWRSQERGGSSPLPRIFRQMTDSFIWASGHLAQACPHTNLGTISSVG